MGHQVQINPIRDQTKETDYGTRQVCDLRWHHCSRIQGLAEMIKVDPMSNNHSVRTNLTLRLIKRISRDNHKIRLTQQLLFAEGAGNHCRRGIEDEIDGALKTKLAHRAFHLEAQQPAIKVANARPA